MSNVLAGLFSAGDRMKRKLGGLLSDPMGTIQLGSTRMAEDTNALARLASEAGYMPNTVNRSDQSVLVSERQKALARALLAEKATEMGGSMAGMFGGANALKADKAALAKAQEMAANGASQKSIWDKTGWFKGGDGQWRFEIDDSAAKLLPADQKAADWMAGPGPAEYPVGGVSNVIKHDALFENYPDLAGIRTRLQKGDSGSYIPNNNGFGESLNLPAIFRNGDYTTPDRTASNALHELQHAIQMREGFALGGTGDTVGYRQLPGEIEARLVEARRLLTPEQRARTAPFGGRNGVPIK